LRLSQIAKKILTLNHSHYGPFDILYPSQVNKSTPRSQTSNLTQEMPRLIDSNLELAHGSQASFFMEMGVKAFFKGTIVPTKTILLGFNKESLNFLQKKIF